MGNHC
jgi:hypothetical protein